MDDEKPVFLKCSRCGKEKEKGSNEVYRYFEGFILCEECFNRITGIFRKRKDVKND